MRDRRKALVTAAVGAFAIVTAALLLPGYVRDATTARPQNHEHYLSEFVESRSRAFGLGGSFGRLPAGTELADIERFECDRARDARREFSWRGAREPVFDCAVVFADTGRKRWAAIIRLAYDGTTPPEGYYWNVPAHIDKAELLIDRGFLPVR